VVLGANATSDVLELGSNLLEWETTYTINAVAQTSNKLTSVVVQAQATTA
jgi:hypothetical protein